MPITLYSGANLKKLKKNELISHIVELYGFIELFDGESIVKLKEENEELNGCLEATTTERDKAFDDINKLKDATKQLNRENEKLKEKATAWNIINNGSDWENLRELCDKEMAKGLIKTGECDEEDFEDYDFGGESDEE